MELLMYRICYGFFIALAIANFAQAEKIKVVTEDAYPVQYQYKNEVVGPAAQLVNLVLTEAGLEYEQRILPWARAYKEAQSQQNTLIYSIARTKEREGLFHWVGSIMDLDYYLMGLESLNLPKNFTFETLKKLRIGTIRNSATEQYLLANGFKNLSSVNLPEQNISMLKKGRIDLFPANIASFQLSCLHIKVNCEQIQPIFNLKQPSTALYMALSLQTDIAIVNKVQKAYQRVMRYSKKGTKTSTFLSAATK